MNKTIIVGLSVFCIFCAALVVDAAFHHPQQTKDLLGRIVLLTSEAEMTTETEAEPTVTDAAQKPAEDIVYPQLIAKNSDPQTVTLGAVYPEIKRTDDADKYKFSVQLTTKGAAVQYVILSEFEAREETGLVEAITGDDSGKVVKDFPLTLLSPLANGKEINSLANASLWVAPVEAKQFDEKAFPLDKLNWQLVPGSSADEARFEAELKDAGTQAKLLKVVKTYRIQPGSYDLDCDIVVENLSGEPVKVQMQMQGPGGLSREDARQDTRKVMTAYQKGNNIETQAQTSIDIRRLEREKIKPAQGFGAAVRNLFSKSGDPEKRLIQTLKEKGDENKNIVWAASTNKYFAAIVRPEDNRVFFNRASFYDADLLENEPAEQAGASFTLQSAPIELAPTGAEGNQQSLNFSIYLGPKDKKIFEGNSTYKAMQYFQTIDFRSCCGFCGLNAIIQPITFGIIWLMNTMYMLMGPLGNYGVVIIILVFLVRVAMHPITKKSQVSMMKMQKLGPKMKEIQAKYADNKQEMNKQVMAMYREQGVSPVSGMLPMFLQMPIWIALWTAVNTSIDIRGAGFLPFWMTDLASPDHLFRFPFGISLPFFGEYFNLLPILMGVVMYLQQKMMPTQTAAQPDSQMAQQQKMMMIMMPLMFPLMLYSGPSGVNLYIMSSITAGVIEQKVIRKHLKEKEELEAIGKVPVTAKTGSKVKKKKPKPMFKG